jgi:hypothetical protein
VLCKQEVSAVFLYLLLSVAGIPKQFFTTCDEMLSRHNVHVKRLRIACFQTRFPFLPRYDITHIRPPQNNIKKSKKTEPRKGIRNLTTFWSARLGPPLSLYASSPVGSSSPTSIACSYTTHFSSAAPRWCSKHFSSSAEVAAASWPLKEEVVAVLSFPMPSLRCCSETNWASARNCDHSRSPRR